MDEKDKKESKRVQKSSRAQNLDFTIFQHICHGSYPSKIARDLGMSKTRIDYYIASLKARDLIQMKHQGVWISLQNYKKKESKKLSRVATNHNAEYLDSFEPDIDRGHSFQFKLKVPRGLRNWNNEKRKEILDKLKIEWIALKHLFGGGERIIFRGKKIHLTNSSIIIYDKASYYAETSKKSQGLAMIKIMYLIKALEHELRASFSINGKYSLKTTRQHHALIKNALAMLYNKPQRKKLDVYDQKGLWLLIDNSFNLEELECVHPETSVLDNEKVQNFFNSLKKDPVTTTEIKNNFEEFKGMFKEISEMQLDAGMVLKQMDGNIRHIVKIMGDKN